MLSAYAAETIAYIDDGSIVCRDCATVRYSTVGVARADLGLAVGELSPLSRYDVDCLRAERVYDYLDAGDGRLPDTGDPDTWPPICCDDCGGEID